MTALYRKRENAFEKGETEYRAEGDALVRHTPGGHDERLAWAKVTSLRLRFSPVMSKRWLHQLIIETSEGAMTIDNSHYQGIGDFEDRSADYSSFVRAALERVAALAPGAQVNIGSSMGSFIAQVAFMTTAMVALAAVLIFLPLPGGSLFVVIGAKLVVVGYLLTLLPRWLRTNWPRRSDFASAARELP